MTAGRSPAGSLEREILLCCARAELDADRTSGLRTLAADPGVDWEGLLALALRHRLLPLLAHHLTSAAADAVPPAPALQLHAALLENTQTALWVLRETLALVKHLEAQGIAAMPFKGTTLSISLYGHPNLRAVGDLDLIVPAAAIEDAVRTAEGLGYRRVHELTPRQQRKFLRDGHHVTMLRPDGMYIEVHWQVAKRAFAYPVDMEAVWRRSRVVREGRLSWRALAPEDLLPILAIQGSKEAWGRMERVASVGAAASRLTDAEWADAVESAEAWGAGRTLRVALLLADRLLGVPLPGEVRGWAGSDRGAERVAARVVRRFEQGGASAAGVAAYHVGVRKGVRQKLRFLFASAFTPGPEDWEEMEVPDRLGWGYALARPFRLLWRYAGRSNPL